MIGALRLCLLTGLLACGGAGSLELPQLDAAAQAARCERAVRCGLLPTVGTCDAYFRTPPPSSFGPARDAGHLDFDGEQAQSCENALGAQPCDLTSREFRVVPEACKRMFRGRIPDGESCAFDEECVSSRCDQEGCSEGVCCIGTCGATHTSGSPGAVCERSSECTDGFCDTDAACHALLSADATCATDEQCGYGLACLSPAPSVPGQCNPLPHIGEACPYQRCADAGAVCDATSHCRAVGLPGAACTAAGDCSPFLECDMTSHVCTELPALGMPCTTRCAGDAYCDSSTGSATCVTLLANGAVCDDSGPCASNNCKPGPVFPSCQDYPVCP